MKSPKFKTSFSSKLQCVVPADTDKYLSLASLDNLKRFIPKSVYGEGKQDLLPIASNLCVLNAKNENDDALTGETGLAIYKTLINKYINIEHSRKYICGSIVDSFFSKFSEDYKNGAGSETLKPEDIKDLLEPFNIGYAGVIYRVIYPALCNFIIDSNDPQSKNFLSIGSSWEVGFEDYNIAIGGIYLKDAEIVTPADEKKFKELNVYLKANKGTGKKDGEYVYRVPSTEILFLGAGLTNTPASAVMGVVVPDDEEELENEENEDETKENSSTATKISVTTNNDINTEDFKITLKKTIQDTVIDVLKNEPLLNLNKSTVTASVENETENLKIMDKITDISQLNDETLKVIKASAITEFIETRVKEANTKFEALQAEKRKVDESHTSIAAQLAEATQKIETLQKNFDELDKREKERIKIEARNIRIASLDDAYNLTNEDRQVIIADIENLSDEDYGKYEGKLKVLLKGKEKQKVSTASVTTVETNTTTTADSSTTTDINKTVSTVIDSSKQTTATLPNTTSPQTESLVEKMKKGFGLNNGIKLQNR